MQVTPKARSSSSSKFKRDYETKTKSHRYTRHDFFLCWEFFDHRRNEIIKCLFVRFSMIDDCAIIKICLFDKVVCSREFFFDSRARQKKSKLGSLLATPVEFISFVVTHVTK